MKIKLLFISCLLAITSLKAQTFEWAKSFGGTGDDEAESIAVDALGNVYTTGYFFGQVDFDPGIGTTNFNSRGSADVFVQKMDSSGNYVWTKTFGGTGYDAAHSIQVDASGNVYTMGHFNGTVDFDPGAGTTNLTSIGLDVFVQKIDASGNFLWAKLLGGTGYDTGWHITINALGDVYTTGSFDGIADFDPGTGTATFTPIGNQDVYVQKMDASGNFLWAKSFGGKKFDTGNSITVGPSGNVYTTGYFNDTVDFDPGTGVTNLVSVGQADIFVQKMDPSGNFLWVKSYGGIDHVQSSSITVDSSGNIYITGYFMGTVDFDPSEGTTELTSNGFEDAFVQKMDSSGNFLWAKSYGGTNSERVPSIALDNFRNVYTIGYFQGTVDFDPSTATSTLTSKGRYDVFVQKMDSLGNFLQAKSFGGGGYDLGESILVDAKGNVYTTGYFEGTADFDPSISTTNLSSTGVYDVFVQKMSPCITTSGMAVITACGSYTWIDGITYTVSNNTAKHTLINANAMGCDSVVTLNLTINAVSDITTVLNGTQISATNTNATYQWLACDNGYAIINGETNQTFTATTNGNYAVELTKNGCLDTSICVPVTTVGLIDYDFGNELTIFPNPTDGNFSIDLGSVCELAEILITDITGKVIDRRSFTQTQVVNLSIDESTGFYFTTIYSGGKRTTFKLIKE